MKRTTVLLADDHSIVVEGLRRVLKTDFDVVDVVEDGLALVKAAERLKPDIIVVDVSMPLLNGIEATRQIRATNLRSKIVFLSMHPDVVYVSEALQAGGSAYVLKSSAGIEIVTAIRKVLQGGTFITLAIDETTLEAQIRRDLRSPDELHSLSQRRREVLQMVAEGRSNERNRRGLTYLPENRGIPPIPRYGIARRAHHCRVGSIRHQTRMVSP